MPQSKFNALKTGAYASTILLPGESAAEFEKLRRAIFEDRRPLGPIERSIVEDIVENRWRRERLRRTTAIETHRHPFGQALEQSGAASWREIAKFRHAQNVARYKSIENLAAPMLKVARFAGSLMKSEMSEDWEDHLQRILDACTKSLDNLERIRIVGDEERDFYDAYSLNNLERLLQLQNSLDAQYDKESARLLREQEQRTFRDKLPKVDEDPGPTSDEEPPKAPSGDTAKADLEDDELLAESTEGDSAAAELLREDDKTGLGHSTDEDEDEDEDWEL